MAPQVASLSELSRIRGDAEVRYPYARTEPELSAPGLDKRPREDGMEGGADEEYGWREGGERVFFSRSRKSGGERGRETFEGRGRDRPQQGDELLVKWLLFSWRASQPHVSGFTYTFPTKWKKKKTTTGKKAEGRVPGRREG